LKIFRNENGRKRKLPGKGALLPAIYLNFIRKVKSRPGQDSPNILAESNGPFGGYTCVWPPFSSPLSPFLKLEYAR